jgi:hypothetical protein
LDCLCCVSILVHCIAALYYNDPVFIKDFPSGAKSLDTILVVMNCLCFVSMLGLFCANLAEGRFREQSVSAIAKKASELVVGLQTELQCRRETMVYALTSCSLVELMGDKCTDKESKVKYDQFRQAANSCLQGSSLVTSPAALETLFFFLKVLSIDDDRASLFLSPVMREELAVDQGIPIQMVNGPS